MEPAELARLSRLLDVALGLPDAAARQRWLDALPSEHAALRPTLQRLLAAHGSSNPALDDGPRLPGMPADADEGARAGPAEGDCVGPWRLVRELGRGGMSIVWLAERVDADPAAPAERVALKLPAVSLDSRAFLARFERERDFLQRLNHPGIARLVEAGVTEGGQHFLALELVDGQPLDVYCDAGGLGVHARLVLFDQVLQAVQHAHSRDVLHRDLKPSNILVTAQGRVRLLDFGIAKLLVDGQADETELTAMWGRALTRDYASPEQFTGGKVTTRSDVYALGVILFELLCGQRPYRVAAGEPHPAHALQAAFEVPLPSECCSEGSAVARAEGGARALSRRLQGALDATLQRALQPLPAARQADAATLADELRGAIGDAAPPARWRYLALAALRSWRRQRAGWMAAALLALALAGQGRLHLWAADVEVLFAPELQPPQQVVLVSIGPEDHQRLFAGTRPLDAKVLRALLSRILAGRPAVVGVDIDTSAPAYAALRQAWDAAAMGRIVWGRDLAASDRAGALAEPRPVLGGSAEAVRSGLALSLVESTGGTVRWFSRAVATPQGPQPSLVGEMVRGLGSAADWHHADTTQRNIRFARATRLELPASVVMADGYDWGSRIDGRVVLLGGRYDPADVHATAAGLMYGLEIVAHEVETELAGRAYARPALGAVLLLGLAQLAATLLLIDRLARAPALAVALLIGVAMAAVLAMTGAFTAWSYSLVVALVVPAQVLLLGGILRRREPLLRWLARLRRGPAAD